jgi:hypothetical protein
MTRADVVRSQKVGCVREHRTWKVRRQNRKSLKNRKGRPRGWVDHYCARARVWRWLRRIHAVRARNREARLQLVEVRDALREDVFDISSRTPSLRAVDCDANTTPPISGLFELVTSSSLPTRAHLSPSSPWNLQHPDPILPSLHDPSTPKITA